MSDRKKTINGLFGIPRTAISGRTSPCVRCMQNERSERVCVVPDLRQERINPRLLSHRGEIRMKYTSRRMEQSVSTVPYRNRMSGVAPELGNKKWVLIVFLILLCTKLPYGAEGQGGEEREIDRPDRETAHNFIIAAKHLKCSGACFLSPLHFPGFHPTWQSKLLYEDTWGDVRLSVTTDMHTYRPGWWTIMHAAWKKARRGKKREKRKQLNISKIVMGKQQQKINK